MQQIRHTVKRANVETHRHTQTSKLQIKNMFGLLFKITTNILLPRFKGTLTGMAAKLPQYISTGVKKRLLVKRPSPINWSTN